MSPVSCDLKQIGNVANWDKIHKRKRFKLNQPLFFIYFLYGLSFFTLGLALLLETSRSPALAEARSLRSLAAFGLIHGFHEWLESYILQAQSLGTPLPAWLPWLRITLLIVSFGALFCYAYLTLRLTSPSYQGRRLFHFDRLAIYEALVLLAMILTYQEAQVPWIKLLDASARYMLAAPSAILAGLALYTQGRQFRREGRASLTAPLSMASLGFVVYGLTQVFVGSINMFPARYLNQEAFLAETGIPIQLLRTALALVIGIGLIQATQVVERERQALLVAAQRSRLDALEQRENLRRELFQHVVRSQEDERARVARELHDEIAQLLSALSLELGTLRSMLKREDTTRAVNRLLGLTKQMSQGLYRLVHDLRPSNLDDLGLVPALDTLVNQDCRQKGLEASLEISGRQQRMNPLIETVLFRVTQEALNNVIRHAEVTHAMVLLQFECDHVKVSISDHGRGFDPNEDFQPPRGWGLAGMRERVEALTGKLNLQSAPGRGTCVEVVIPLGANSMKEIEDGHHHIDAR